MAKSVQITKHARHRFAERLELTRREDMAHFFRNAVMYGLSPHSFKGKFHTYLLNKLKKNSYCTVKVYNDFIYIHRNKKLITMFPVPEKYLPVKQWLPSVYNSMILEKENIPELTLRKYYKTGDIHFYTKPPGKNGKSYLVALVINNMLASVAKGKDEAKLKISCVNQHLEEMKKKGQE